MTLFSASAPRPLADRLRPKTLAEVVGQDHLLKPSGPVGRMISSHRLASMILWGPPGCGKTTIARLLADQTELHFEPLSAVFSGVADLRKVFEPAKQRRGTGRGTLLFIDEIHRFNRSQQDGFLPYVEDGTVTLVGATTENPSFELNAALLSRAQVFVLNRLDDAALELLLTRAEAEMGKPLPLDPDARQAVKAMADGDGRFLLNLCEELFALAPETPLDTTALVGTVQRRAPLYDKSQEGHYNLISALHKSVRGSDTDAALYWLTRMLDGGEDPRYIARRLVRMAVEDIGLADPQALPQALAAWETYERLGLAGRRAGDRPMHDLHGDRAEIQRRLYRLQGGHAHRAGNRVADAAQAYPQRADQDDEGPGIRQRLRIRPRHRRRFQRPELFPRWNAAPAVLPSSRTRVRAGDPQASGVLEQAAGPEIRRSE